MSRFTPRAPAAPERTPLAVGTTIAGTAWAVARFEGMGNRMLRYRASGRAGRRAELREYFPAGWERTEAGYRKPGEPSREIETMAYFQAGFELAREAGSHRNRAHVIDVIQAPETFFVVQEWLEGPTLGEWVRTGGPLALREALSVVGQIGAALADLHQNGLLHRDVSPNNILLEEGRAVLIDFESLTSFPQVRTLAGQGFANPQFAPLELLSVFPRYGPESDVYGLAACLFFALTGKPAPPAAKRVASPSLPKINGIPDGLQEALGRAMAVRVKERTASVPAFFDELDQAIRR